MHILYIHQYFATRQGRTGTRSFEFARQLVGRGHRVTMITSGLANEQFPVEPGADFTRHEVDGIQVVAVRGGYNDPHQGTGMGGLRRMAKFYEFARTASRAACRMHHPDVVFATHTPLTVGLAGMRIRKHFGVPFVFEVRDLWPEALVNVGALRNPAVVWWLRRMARRIYRAADHIVALSPGMKEGILRSGIPEGKVTVIPNCSDLDLFRPDVDGDGARRRLRLGDRFVVLYFGAMGFANGLEYVIEAARILADRGNRRVVFVLHGDGGRRPALQQIVRECGIENVVFSDLVPSKEEVARVVAASNVCLTIYRAAREQSWSPNKMFDALAAGKPVVINVGGWLGRMIEENSCGHCVDPVDATTLADAVERLSQDPERCEEYGRNARRLAEREFDRAVLAERLNHVLTAATQTREEAGPR